MTISRRNFIKWGLGVTGLGLMASYPFMIERYIVHVNHYRLSVRDLPESFEGFRIVHLTDLHYGSLVPLWWLRRVMRLTTKQKPDLIVLTGDYVRGRDSREGLDTIWPEILKLDAPSGVKMVLGNHDHWAAHDHALELLENSGRSLRNRAEVIVRGRDELVLAGVGDLLEDEVGIDAALEGIDDRTPRLVLAHNPDTADMDYYSRVDWFICGHTHGGQVDIPFIGTPVLPVRNKKYNYGVKSNGRSKLFISKGIGWAVYPVRFNCAPEVAVLELTSRRA